MARTEIHDNMVQGTLAAVVGILDMGTVLVFVDTLNEIKLKISIKICVNKPSK